MTRLCSEVPRTRLASDPWSLAMREVPTEDPLPAERCGPSSIAAEGAAARVGVTRREPSGARPNSTVRRALAEAETAPPEASTPPVLCARGTAAVRRVIPPPAPPVVRPPVANGGRFSFVCPFLSTQLGSSFFTRSKSSFGKPSATSSSSRRLSSAASRPELPALPPILTCIRLKSSFSRRAVSDTSRSSSFVRELMAVVRRSSLSTSCGKQMSSLKRGRRVVSWRRTLGTRS
mmetsp:Transcript_30421/g.54489  ORF Transcript_30421/g.54489 Transcript_30421/m.54489 type:complete len:233 (-) Transcript_30421:2476-3174(-)